MYSSTINSGKSTGGVNSPIRFDASTLCIFFVRILRLLTVKTKSHYGMLFKNLKNIAATEKR